MYYCLVKMTVDRPGSRSAFGFMGRRMEFRLTLVAAETEEQLLKEYQQQCGVWKKESAGLAKEEGTQIFFNPYECCGTDFIEVKYDEYGWMQSLPANPMKFDTNAIESQEAWDNLRGEFSDCENCWNRFGWRFRDDMELDPDENPEDLTEINRELAVIAGQPKIKSHELKYFVGVH